MLRTPERDQGSRSRCNNEYLKHKNPEEYESFLNREEQTLQSIQKPPIVEYEAPFQKVLDVSLSLDII
jgi:hypothetical protein